MVAGWVALNLALPQAERIDPFPFPLLTLVLSVEAIFLAVFILMSQNRAARIRGKRSLLDLQLNLLAEQENTKMVEMLEQIGKAVGADFGSSEAVRVFEEATQPEALSDQIEQAVSGGEKRSGAE
ncbi:MAG TPA: DUF1003 domain-containing protein [Gemmatimonadales bacterium]